MTPNEAVTAYSVPTRSEQLGVLSDYAHDLTVIARGTCIPQLEALADGLVAPARQARLEELLAKNAEGALPRDDVRELECLLELADQLTILKTRARYTLNQLNVEASAS